MLPKKITILGAGLTGSLLANLLAQKGFDVSIYEKRPDLRTTSAREGRSINLALSHRGWHALEHTRVLEKIRDIVIPMRGRMLHDLSGNLTFQPYGKSGQAINSVSRDLLNQLLIDAAEQRGVKIHFSHLCKQVDLAQNTVHVENMLTEEMQKFTPDLLIGADGAFSSVRNEMQRTPRYNYSQTYIEHGYKELTIPPTQNNDFALDKHALHIWPRGKYMLIALPNMDKSFTCTLFLPFEGENSFEALQTPQQVSDFFHQTFPDTIPLMPRLEEEFFENPTSNLVTIKCFPWSRYGSSLLIGDAAHAIVPFYGQGMNAGFEDCRIFNELLETNPDSWKALLEQFQVLRKPNADAVAELALQNFVEMRDLVADPKFQKRKKIEARLHELFPEQWIPLYTMVTFSDMPYADALAIGKKQDQIMEEVLAEYENTDLENIDYQKIIDQFIS